VETLRIMGMRIVNQSTIHLTTHHREHWDIAAVIANKIEYVMGFKQGMGYKLNESWTISKPDGSEDRNLIGKYLDWLPAHGPDRAQGVP